MKKIVKKEVHQFLNRVDVGSKESELGIVAVDSGKDSMISLQKNGHEVGTLWADENKNVRLRTIDQQSRITLAPSGIETMTLQVVAETADGGKVAGYVMYPVRVVGIATPTVTGAHVFSFENGPVVSIGTTGPWDWHRMDGQELISDAGDK